MELKYRYKMNWAKKIESVNKLKQMSLILALKKKIKAYYLKE